MKFLVQKEDLRIKRHMEVEKKGSKMNIVSWGEMILALDLFGQLAKSWTEFPRK